MSDPSPPEPTTASVRRRRFSSLWVGGLVTVGLAGVAGLIIAWFADVGTELLALGLAFVAGVFVLAVYHVVVTTDRGQLRVARTDVGDQETGSTDLVASRSPSRRQLLGGIAGGLALLAAGGWVLRRFGPSRPAGSAWENGSHLVTIAGDRVRPQDIPLGGVVTVWPEDAVGTERAAVMIIRLREEPLEPTQLDGVVDGTLVAYSRLCTHAGCAVALYRDRDQALFCPCHQATFDARRGATPMSGPASTPLPQLPLGIADDGTLIAVGDLTRQPGPVSGTVAT